MAKRLTTQEKREKALIDIINKMFEIAGHDVTFDDVKGRKDEWYTQWTMTIEQNDEWSLNRRYMQLEGLQTLCDTAPTRLSAVAR